MSVKSILLILAFVIFVLAACDFPAGTSPRLTAMGLALLTLSFLV